MERRTGEWAECTTGAVNAGVRRVVVWIGARGGHSGFWRVVRRNAPTTAARRVWRRETLARRSPSRRRRHHICSTDTRVSSLSLPLGLFAERHFQIPPSRSFVVSSLVTMAFVVAATHTSGSQRRATIFFASAPPSDLFSCLLIHSLHPRLAFS
uniref:Uncharacterized protein n=1 Tax=Plectus sambesii TaxID=2011161 RepID=A0A914UTM7_9BILA